MNMRWIGVLGLGVALSVVAWRAAPGQAPAGERAEVTVDQVLDGDTIEVSSSSAGSGERVRILGINAPEIAHPGKAGQCYGQEATSTLEQLLAGHPIITIISDPSQDDRDVYGRLLRYVELDGHDVGHEQVAAGAAEVRDDHPQVDRHEQYLQSQRQAQATAAGKWGKC